jgi:hypothetical protein
VLAIDPEAYRMGVVLYNLAGRKRAFNVFFTHEEYITNGQGE